MGHMSRLAALDGLPRRWIQTSSRPSARVRYLQFGAHWELPELSASFSLFCSRPCLLVEGYEELSGKSCTQLDVYVVSVS